MTQIEKVNAGTHIVVPKWDQYLRYLSLISLISIIFYMGSWTSKAESKMFDTPAQKEKVVSHSVDKNKHSDIKEQEEHFVTRREYIVELKNINANLKDIKDAVRTDKK